LANILKNRLRFEPKHIDKLLLLFEIGHIGRLNMKREPFIPHGFHVCTDRFTGVFQRMFDGVAPRETARNIRHGNPIHATFVLVNSD
jgi:hypothetical protein